MAIGASDHRSSEDASVKSNQHSRIVMLLPVSTQARFWKRHDGLHRLGASLKVMSFVRPHYEDKSRESSWISMGTLRHGKYLARIPVLLAAVPRVLRETVAGDTLYCFGPDLLALGWVVSVIRGRKCPLVLETADIRSVLVGTGTRSRLLRAIERFLVKRTALVVCTSSHYVDEYYIGRLNATDAHYMILENKLDPEGLPPREQSRHERVDDTLVIGYFGLLRCQESWDFLMRLAEEGAGRIRVVAAGLPTGIEDIDGDVATSPYLEYLGTYVSPDDLPDLYGRVDLVWIVYPQGEPNQQWARTNRFYEAGYFCKPMIAIKGAPDGVEVERADLGPLIDLSSPDDAVRLILSISEAQMQEWDNHYGTVDVATFTLTDEHSRLLETIREAARIPSRRRTDRRDA